MINGFHGDNAFLSNMYLSPRPLRIDGVLYKSSENYYQGQKSKCTNVHKHIASKSPSRSKMDSPTPTSDWEERKLGVMLNAIRAKFNHIPEFKELLLATGDKYLEETNTWNDTFWGVCNGHGKNHLGKILMQVRKEIKG